MQEKSVTVCFVANFYKTFMFHEVAKKLTIQGIKVCWIVTKLDQYNFLIEYYGRDQVLYINRSHAYKTDRSIGDFRLNELVYGDRVFKFDLQHGLDFLTNIQRPIYNFLLNHKIRFIFGEITWAHELLIRRIALKQKELNCIYLDCSLVRIPNNRMAFFTDESQNCMLEFNLPIITTEIIKLEKPAYLKINDVIVKKNSSLTARLKRIKRFFSGENIEENDPNVIVNKPVRIKVTGREEYNRLAYTRIQTKNFEELENENYVFIGFHKQPESSIDVSGRYYEDQAQNIINIWRLLPEGWKIVLKEHTNAIGDRSYGFYQKLLSYPGIVMANEKTDSKKLIAKSRLVVTVTGTIAYEAALMKVSAITFSKVFFNRINFCRHVTLNDLIAYDSLVTLIEELKSQDDNRLEFSNYLMKNTFDAYISDHVTDPSVMKEENIQKLSHAFMTLVQHYGNSELKIND
jgi:hypothetical protein